MPPLPFATRGRWLMGAVLAYALVVTAVAGVAVYKAELWRSVAARLGIATPPHEVTPFSREMTGHLRRLADNALPGGVVFLGDSQLQGLDIRRVTGNGLNLAIGGETTARLLARLPDYRDLDQAEALVLLLGVNDLKFRPPAALLANYRTLLAQLPPRVPLLLVALPPIDPTLKPALHPQAINQVNVGLAALCRARPSCRLVDAGPELSDANGHLRADVHEGDGLHLNAEGYRRLARAVRSALAAVLGEARLDACASGGEER